MVETWPERRDTRAHSKIGDDAVSKVLAEVILIAITLLLALLVLLLFFLPGFNSGYETPRVIIIKAIYHTNEDPPYRLNNDSRIVLYHNGTSPFFNDDLRAAIYVNGRRVNAIIETLNGQKFISTHHFGVQKISGSGCQGKTWEPGEKLVIDLADNTIHEGDSVTVEIIDKKTNSTISRDVYGQDTNKKEEWWRCSLPYPIGCV